MGFNVGETVGPYKITQYIGQGGMATIYRAHQLTLDRDVALKVIHPALKEDQSFLMRLNREAAIVAKLNHPNIVTVYDFGEHDGIPYLVMRFIDGKTLKAILQERKLKTDQILAIVRPVADALTYAHSRGVLHRDVKSSNILIDNDGQVFLADFGLARLARSGESTLSQDMLIGSPHYISPEQAKGERVDERTDVYSLGVVLFEMFTGRLPFSGDTPYVTIMAHINDPPPAPRSINPKIPLAVEKVIQKTLAKDRTERYVSVSEMMSALEEAVRGPREQTKEEPQPTLVDLVQSAPRLNPLARAGAQIRTAFAQFSSEPQKCQRIVAALGALLALCIFAACVVGIGALALQTPLVSLFSPSRATTPRLTRVIAPLTTLTRATLTTPTARASIGIVTATPTRLAAVRRGKIAYTVATGDAPEQHAIWIADADGTDARPIVEMAMWPALSPDGKHIAYYRLKDNGIYVANSDGGAPRKVLGFADTCCVQWSPDSKQLVYFRGNLKVGGAVFTANVDGSNPTEIASGFNPSWSPDGNRLAYTSCQPNTNQCGIFLFNLKTKTATMITRDNGGNPQWSPRGDKIVYQADDGKGHVNVFVVNADGSGIKQLTSGKSNDGQPVWSRDGNWIFWRSDQNGTAWAIYVMRADGSNPRRLINNVAPDGNLWGRESLSAGP